MSECLVRTGRFPLSLWFVLYDFPYHLLSKGKVRGGGGGGKEVSERKGAFGGKQNLTFPQNFP